MGLFNWGKKKAEQQAPDQATVEIRVKRSEINTSSSPKMTQEDILESLAEFNEDRGDRATAFYFRNKTEIDSFQNEITGFLLAAQSAENDDLRLMELNNAKAAYEALRFSCCSQPDGLQYYDRIDLIGPDRVSRYDNIKKRIADCEYKMSIAPAILEKAQDGILQSDLIKMFDKVYPSEVRLIIQKLEDEGKIYKEKSGRSFMIKAK